MRGRLTLVLLSTLFLPSIAASAGSERVLESFEVGKNVMVRALTVDPAVNALWVGTSAGVMEIDLKTRQPRNIYTRMHGLTNDTVLAAGVDSQGYKWFGTDAGGASRFKDGKWRTYLPMHGLADYRVSAFASDRDGNLWIGAWGGANKFDIKTGKFTTYAKELINKRVYAIAGDADGRVWFGTEGGISMYDGKRWKHWTHKDGIGAANLAGLPGSHNAGKGKHLRYDLTPQLSDKNSYHPNYIFSILAAPDKNVWAGTWGAGVSHYDGKSWSNLTTKDGLAGNIVYAIARDAKGVFWFGTDNGVSRYDGKSWKNIGRKDGLPDSHVYAVAVTPNGEVWAGTKKGATHIGIEPQQRQAK
ncbi:MAG: two-component regulator propeller domain-containing protein [Sterolibacterium sp.]